MGGKLFKDHTVVAEKNPGGDCNKVVDLVAVSHWVFFLPRPGGLQKQSYTSAGYPAGTEHTN